MTVVEKVCERVPAFEHVVHRLADIAVTRELATLRSHPGLQLRDQLRHAFTTHRQALVDGAAIDLTLEVEDRIDALDRLDRKRREHRQRPARLGSDVGKLEELAPAMCPATRLRDWAGPAICGQVLSPSPSRGRACCRR